MELTTLPRKFGEWIFILLSAVIIILANLSLSLSWKIILADFKRSFQKEVLKLILRSHVCNNYLSVSNLLSSKGIVDFIMFGPLMES